MRMLSLVKLAPLQWLMEIFSLVMLVLTQTIDGDHYEDDGDGDNDDDDGDD